MLLSEKVLDEDEDGEVKGRKKRLPFTATAFSFESEKAWEWGGPPANTGKSSQPRLGGSQVGG